MGRLWGPENYAWTIIQNRRVEIGVIAVTSALNV